MDDEIECYVSISEANTEKEDIRKETILNVYIPSVSIAHANIKFITQVKTDKSYENNSLQSCKVFVINDETSLKKKIRIMLV
jgi:hypothetical protein